MALGRPSEFDDLYKQAQNILLHEMTEDEQRFLNLGGKIMTPRPRTNSRG
jgi:hypothetical protein